MKIQRGYFFSEKILFFTSLALLGHITVFCFNNKAIFANEPEHKYSEISFQREIQKQLSEERYKSIKYSRLFNFLGIKPGMTVLDIGAGLGFFTFQFAKEVGPDGKVFATDISQNAIDYIRKELLLRGLNNVSPVVVQDKGVDPFYAKNQYDLIFICRTYHLLEDRTQYLRKMNKFLKKNGKLAIIILPDVPDLSPDSFIDMKGLIKAMIQNDTDPFYQNLSPRTKELLRTADLTHPNSALEVSLVSDFNILLKQPQFYRQLLDGRNFAKNIPFTLTEKEFVNWLVMTLNEKNSLTKTWDQLTLEEQRSVRKLNKILLYKRFQTYFVTKHNSFGEPAYVGGSDKHRHINSMIVQNEAQQANFRFEVSQNLTPYDQLLIFSKP